MGRDGRRNQKQVAGFGSREDAEAALAEVLAGQGGGNAGTLAGFLERVWLPAKQAEVERSTFDQYAWAVRRHVVPWFGAARLGDLTPAMLDGWLAGLVVGDPATGRSALSSTSARLVRKVLSMACGDAVEHGFLAHNPVVRTETPAAAGSRPQGWTVKQARRFLTAVGGDRLGVAFHLALVTGLRRGELLALRWSDVDLDRGRMRIAQHLVVEGGRVRLKPLAGEPGQAVMFISPRIVRMLVEHRGQQDDERVLAGDAWCDAGFVFSTALGGWVSPGRFSRVMDDFIERAGVPRITPQGLRRTARMLAQASHDSVVAHVDAMLAP